MADVVGKGILRQPTIPRIDFISQESIEKAIMGGSEDYQWFNAF